MERLTIPDVKVDAHTTRRTMIDVGAVREHAMEIYWRLKAYEDVFETPEKAAWAKQTIEMAFADDQQKAERLRELYKADKDGRALILEKEGANE